MSELVVDLSEAYVLVPAQMPDKDTVWMKGCDCERQEMHLDRCLNCKDWICTWCFETGKQMWCYKCRHNPDNYGKDVQ